MVKKTRRIDGFFVQPVSAEPLQLPCKLFPFPR